MTIRTLPLVRSSDRGKGLSICEHRTVSKDGCIVCAKIVEGDRQVSPDVCRACPVKAINCAHLRFSLHQTSPSRLIVRYNGRTEIWDDDPPEVKLEYAACAAQVIPIEHPRVCAGCSLRQAVETAAERPERRPAARTGTIVPFPLREAVAAAG
jgi:hypothetical protein